MSEPIFTTPFVDIEDCAGEPLVVRVDTPAGTVRAPITLSQGMWLLGRLSIALAQRVDWNSAALTPAAPDSGPRVQ